MDWGDVMCSPTAGLVDDEGREGRGEPVWVWICRGSAPDEVLNGGSKREMRVSGMAATWEGVAGRSRAKEGSRVIEDPCVA